MKTMFRLLTTVIFLLFSFAGQSQEFGLPQKSDPFNNIQKPLIDSSGVLFTSPVDPLDLNLSSRELTQLTDSLSKYLEKDPLDNMPILNPGSLKSVWNMPVAVPDSTVVYYIQNPMLQSGRVLPRRK